VKTETRDTLRRLIAARLEIPIAELGDEVDLRSLRGVESIKILECVVAIEARFDVELEDEDVFGCSTIAGLADIVDQLVAERTSAAWSPRGEAVT
jgi:acyl carrier protein